MRVLSLPLLALALVGACAPASNGASSAASPGTPVDVTREANAQSAATGVYFEFQVEHPARELEGSCVALYPDSLRAAGKKGEVVANFVVDTAGRPEAQTFKVVRSSHDLFTRAVRDALSCMGSTPATLRGR